MPDELRRKDLSLTLLKSKLLQYYHDAVKNVYDINDARTWKSVCLKCNAPRKLVQPTYVLFLERITCSSSLYFCKSLFVCMHQEPTVIGFKLLWCPCLLSSVSVFVCECSCLRLLLFVFVLVLMFKLAKHNK